ncbi:hypothetical protein AAG570_002180 [Ranatra chinensis]|uniref:Uncharacterized protein n=1 Tax=Ranatra chinensis TaxID=642074 RepID=A0ABD0Y772_9HEMI
MEELNLERQGHTGGSGAARHPRDSDMNRHLQQMVENIDEWWWMRYQYIETAIFEMRSPYLSSAESIKKDVGPLTFLRMNTGATADQNGSGSVTNGWLHPSPSNVGNIVRVDDASDKNREQETTERGMLAAITILLAYIPVEGATTVWKFLVSVSNPEDGPCVIFFSGMGIRPKSLISRFLPLARCYRTSSGLNVSLDDLYEKKDFLKLGDGLPRTKAGGLHTTLPEDASNMGSKTTEPGIRHNAIYSGRLSTTRPRQVWWSLFDEDTKKRVAGLKKRIKVDFGTCHVTLAPGVGLGPELCQCLVDVFSCAGAPVSFEVIEQAHQSDADFYNMIHSIRRNGIAIKVATRDFDPYGSAGACDWHKQLRTKELRTRDDRLR